MKNNKKQTRLLTIQETAARTGYKDGTVRSWANERLIPHVRVGHCIRIPEDALEAFIARNTIPAK